MSDGCTELQAEGGAKGVSGGGYGGGAVKVKRGCGVERRGRPGVGLWGVWGCGSVGLWGLWGL